MLKLIAAAGAATLLAGCVVAPDAGYGYGQPYYSDPGYAYAPSPVYGTVNIWAVAADATGIAAGATTIAGTAIVATAATAGGAAADTAVATGTMAAEAAAIATDAHLQPLYRVPRARMADASRRRTEGRARRRPSHEARAFCRSVR